MSRLQKNKKNQKITKMTMITAASMLVTTLILSAVLPAAVLPSASAAFDLSIRRHYRRLLSHYCHHHQ
jgi:hypothetical protein